MYYCFIMQPVFTMSDLVIVFMKNRHGIHHMNNKQIVAIRCLHSVSFFVGRGANDEF